MKCNNCGNSNAALSMTLIIKNLQIDKKIIKEGCAVCVTAEILAAHRFAKKMGGSPQTVKVIEEMAEKMFEKSYEKFKNSMDTKH